MLVSTSLPTFGFPAETPPEPGGIRERAALESSNGVITLCLTVPLTHKPGCEDSFSSPSVYASPLPQFMRLSREVSPSLWWRKVRICFLKSVGTSGHR